MSGLPLQGVRIVDVTVIWGGPYATQLLADWGAEVIRVESRRHFAPLTRGTVARPPKASQTRDRVIPQGTYCDRDPGERPWNRFVYFNTHARNKLSMTVDLTKPEGKDIFRRLVRESDVFIENNALEVVEKWGWTYEALRQIKPDIIVANMPSLGLTGPYKYYRMRGFELECLAGHSLLRGYTDRDPTTLTESYHCDAVSGVCAALAIVMALLHRRTTGQGLHVEVAQAESLIPQLGQAVMDYTMNQRVQTTLGNRDPAAAPCGCYRCQGEEKWINITITTDDEWQALCRAMGHPAWSQEERFSDGLSRWRNQEELDRRIEEWTGQHDHDALMFKLQEVGVPAGAVLDSGDCFADPQLKERGFFERLTQVDCGTHLYPGLSWKMSKTPNRLRLPPCCLGEHNEYVYKEVLGVSDEEYARLEAGGHIGMDYVPEIP